MVGDSVVGVVLSVVEKDIDLLIIRPSTSITQGQGRIYRGAAQNLHRNQRKKVRRKEKKDEEKERK